MKLQEERKSHKILKRSSDVLARDLRKKGDKFMKNIQLKYKNIDIKSIFELPEIMLGIKNVPDYASDLDYEYLVEIANKQKILAIFYKVYNKYINDEYRHIIESRIEEINSMKNFQLSGLKAIKDEFERLNIEFVLIKGFAIAQATYGDIHLRDFNDCDILVNIESFAQADKAMRMLGYRSSIGNREVPDLLSLECYELAYYKEYIPGKEVRVEIKLGTSSIKEPEIIERFVKHKELIEIKGESYYSFSLNDTFILLCTNTYYNFEIEFGAARIRDLIDIKMFYEKYKNDLEWEYIEKFASENRQTHQMFAVMNLVNYYYANTFPKEHINQLISNNVVCYKEESQEYSHGWLRDWMVEPVDVMLDRELHIKEMHFQQSCKAYSSRNSNYYSRIFVLKSNVDLLDGKPLQGLSSMDGSINFLYKLGHSENKIYFKLVADICNAEGDITYDLMFFDIDRKKPRKAIHFMKENGMWRCETDTSELICNEIERSNNDILIEIDKKSFRILDEGGRVLCFYMYSLVKYHDSVDFALRDSNGIMNYDNPIMIYFCD